VRMSEAFPSNWLKAADLAGHSVKVVVDRVVIEDIGDNEKPVMYFQGKQKGVVLNKTNANMIVEYYGDETAGWVGKEIELYPDKVGFQGKIVDCIRVRIQQQAPPAAEGEEPPF
jgi:hypothetical protein